MRRSLRAPRPRPRPPYVRWCGDEGCEKEVKDALKVTIRCLPLDGELAKPFSGPCVACGKPAAEGQPRAVWAKSY